MSATSGDESRKGQGRAQLKVMLGRWTEEDGEFRQYTGWRTDTLKMLGAGNSTGLLSVAVFLSSGIRAGLVAMVAKSCLVLFFSGIAAFTIAYRNLYRFAGDVEDALRLLRNGTGVDDATVRKCVRDAIDKSEASGILILVATLCLVAGSCIALIGLLMV